MTSDIEGTPIDEWDEIAAFNIGAELTMKDPLQVALRFWLELTTPAPRIAFLQSLTTITSWPEWDDFGGAAELVVSLNRAGAGLGGQVHFGPEPGVAWFKILTGVHHSMKTAGPILSAPWAIKLRNVDAEWYVEDLVPDVTFRVGSISPPSRRRKTG